MASSPDLEKGLLEQVREVAFGASTKVEAQELKLNEVAEVAESAHQRIDDANSELETVRQALETGDVVVPEQPTDQVTAPTDSMFVDFL